jgi:RNA polymerase sigma-70 factor (ECF subfamily)
MIIEHAANAMSQRVPPNGQTPGTPLDATAVVEAYAEPLVRHAFRRLGNLADAQDVVQDVFVRLFARGESHEPFSSVGAYLYRCVTNGCTDALRQRQRSSDRNRQLGQNATQTESAEPSQDLLAAEELRRVEGLLVRLPWDQAETVRLRVLDGLQLHEIAELVGCSEATITSRLRYGLEKLRTLLLAGARK